ncbi:unnamed protein product [Urochloa humidicola]
MRRRRRRLRIHDAPPPPPPDPSPGAVIRLLLSGSTPRSKIRSGRSGGRDSASASASRARGGGRFALPGASGFSAAWLLLSSASAGCACH